MHTTKFSLLILMIIAICIKGFSQTNIEPEPIQVDNVFNKGLKLLDNGNYREAADKFIELLSVDSLNANWNYLTGLCYLNIPLEKEKSIKFLKQAVKNVSLDAETDYFEETIAPVEAYFYLGEAFHKNYKFEDAIDILSVLKFKYVKDDPEFEAMINKLISECETGIELTAHPVEMSIQNLGNKINTKYSEHSPVFTADESILIFTSKRKGSTGNIMTDDGQYKEDIYISFKEENGWSEPFGIGNTINTAGHEATIGLSADGQELFIYKDDNNDGNIYYSKLNGDSWSKPEKMGSDINTKDQETHASLSADGKSIYFTSDRKGGYGGKDIYIVRKLPTGEWSKAQNLGDSINTPYDEEGPYIHPDGVSLYFSSCGHKTMGGYDIFISTYNPDNKTWSTPENLGYPVNTTEDDVFYTPTVDGTRAYYSSYKAGGIGNNDLYIISTPDAEAKTLAVYTGKIEFCNGSVPKEGYISITDTDWGDEYGVYTPNSKTGKYLFILPIGRSFNINYTTENNFSKTIKIEVEEKDAYQKQRKAIELTPIIFGCPEKEFTMSFANNEIKLNSKHYDIIDEIINYIRENPHYDIKFTTSEGNNFERNTKEREQAIKKVLTERGITSKKIFTSFDNTLSESICYINITGNDANQDITSNAETRKIDINEDLPEALQSEIAVNDIIYEFNKDTTYEYYSTLNAITSFLNNNPEAKIKLIGYTDSLGTESYNLKLSKKRALFAKKYMVKMGGNPKQIETEGLGESQQIAFGNTNEERKYNRRVEIHVLKQGTKQKLSVHRIEVPDNLKIVKTN